MLHEFTFNFLKFCLPSVNRDLQWVSPELDLFCRHNNFNEEQQQEVYRIFEKAYSQILSTEYTAAFSRILPTMIQFQAIAGKSIAGGVEAFDTVLRELISGTELFEGTFAPTTRFATLLPDIGTEVRHFNGNYYQVSGFSNLNTTNLSYMPCVHYFNIENGSEYNKNLYSFRTSFLAETLRRQPCQKKNQM